MNPSTSNLQDLPPKALVTQLIELMQALLAQPPKQVSPDDLQASMRQQSDLFIYLQNANLQSLSEPEREALSQQIEDYRLLAEKLREVYQERLHQIDDLFKQMKTSKKVIGRYRQPIKPTTGHRHNA